MKRVLLLIGMGLLSFHGLLAQKTFILSTLDHKGFVNVSAGYSLPMGSPFGKNTEKIVGPGESAQVSAGYRLGRHLGLTAQYAITRNGVLEEALRSGLTSPDGWEIRSTEFEQQSLMVGPMMQWAAGRFLFNVHLTAGYAMASSPRTEVYGSLGRLPMSFTTESKRASALALGGGTSVRFKINRWLSAHVNANYITANLNYKELARETKIGQQRSVEPLAGHQPSAMIATGLGFGVLF